MEMLSEHTLEGWAEGYVLTDRHAFLASYPAFFHIIDSMVNQHAKWLEKCKTEVADQCLRRVDYVNVIVADKQLHFQYLDIDAAVRHCEKASGSGLPLRIKMPSPMSSSRA